MHSFRRFTGVHIPESSIVARITPADYIGCYAPHQTFGFGWAIFLFLFVTTSKQIVNWVQQFTFVDLNSDSAVLNCSYYEIDLIVKARVHFGAKNGFQLNQKIFLVEFVSSVIETDQRQQVI